MRFHTGDNVTWASQAGGSTSTKFGTVVEVVPKRQRPQTMNRRLTGGPRDHESYVVVAVAEGTKRRRRRSYWPKVKNLTLMTPRWDVTFIHKTTGEVVTIVAQGPTTGDAVTAARAVSSDPGSLMHSMDEGVWELRSAQMTQT